jgi:soluble lytic murein transglycosylase-like protein
MRKRVFVRILLAWLAFPALAHAAVHPPANLMPCFEMAADRYHVDVALLVSIAAVESAFDPKAMNSNKNGSRDIGIMQINSSWFPRLQRDFNIAEESIWNPCTNIMVGAWVLAGNIAELGATWDAVGAYNARSRHKRVRYVNLVKRKLEKWTQ